MKWRRISDYRIESDSGYRIDRLGLTMMAYSPSGEFLQSLICDDSARLRELCESHSKGEIHHDEKMRYLWSS